ncbi:hypothetical protein A7A08_02452 [Methyloligella halotolerans]|uniref:Cytochrome P460 domain-containing protein n=1 Tax=Methyloligella halotolerans TaxID=1177755 RepID=A0A1E2RWS8_9HYPH|nr:cytochrome P460 family protein [Methyloligella halotolerans]ODA66684.1 hypothetical protein A7A08_02452 [Methyloligella halotolerans]
MAGERGECAPQRFADRASRLRRFWPVLFLGVPLAFAGYALPLAGTPAPSSAQLPAYCAEAKQADLPLPSQAEPDAYQRQLFAFLNDRTYAKLGWCVDKSMDDNLVRDTGPYVNNVYFGTHPAVRVYYSPKMMQWLLGDRDGPPEDGAFIVKEMFEPPAARYEGMDDAQVVEKLKSWTVMVRDTAGAHDGWYWSNPVRGESQASAHDYPFKYRESGFGQYCLRCHASAADHGTFSSLRNIKGFPGDPLRFRVDDSWRDHHAAAKPWQPGNETEEMGEIDDREVETAYRHLPDPSDAEAEAEPHPGFEPSSPDPAFLETYPEVKDPGFENVQRFPSETHDRVVAHAGMGPGFVSSDQCMGCHGGINGNQGTAAGPVMFFQTGPDYGEGYNVSPYGEWRWSPMGLAGRDPIFHAQLDSEIALLEKEFGTDGKVPDEQIAHLQNLCFSCHGAMGQRQLKEDAAKLGLDPLFKRDYLFLTSKEADNPYAKYGALARDGISCGTCHRARQSTPVEGLSELKSYLTHNTTGRFETGAPDEIYGPFKDEEIVTLPMKNALGITPKHDSYIQSSRLCGSCHHVSLPNVDMPLSAHAANDLDASVPAEMFKDFKHSIEQATYMEWLNSGYQNEFPAANPTPERAQSCQGCHMPSHFKSADGKVDVKQIKTRIAAVQDDSYPEAEHMPPVEEIRVRFREEGFKRHRLQGLNGMLMEIFRQNNDVLGVRTKDYMTGADGLKLALDEVAAQARERTADLDVTTKLDEDGKLIAEVEVVNKTGHRFPTGVGLRRAFLELLVIDGSGGRERVVWGSGRTNAVGVLVDEKGNILPTEFFEKDETGAPRYQHHHEVIDSQDQVQVYEELLRNAEGEFTTSFVHRANHVKDNRLLPFGWQEKGPLPDRYSELKDFIHATHPGQDAIRDEDYRSGKGLDRVRYEIELPEGVDADDLTVRATLYYQPLPPHWLKERFATAPDMPATQRLYYIASRLKLDGTPMENWKFKLTSKEAKVSAR